jgi:hypothetical protein
MLSFQSGCGLVVGMKMRKSDMRGLCGKIKDNLLSFSAFIANALLRLYVCLSV